MDHIMGSITKKGGNDELLENTGLRSASLGINLFLKKNKEIVKQMRVSKMFKYFKFSL